MIDMNSAIHDHRTVIRSAAGELRYYAKAFSIVGNATMADVLSNIAGDINEAADRVTQAWSDELSRVVKENDKALADTLRAAFSRGS